mmetsp:Transcript_7751/g.14076  ORF Transcript_7751/g.14076 Transcript_7751/m.14076 type:complete len:87 (-) Transcript_7751:64-324(-)
MVMSAKKLSRPLQTQPWAPSAIEWQFAAVEASSRNRVSDNISPIITRRLVLGSVEFVELIVSPVKVGLTTNGHVVSLFQIMTVRPR